MYMISRWPLMHNNITRGDLDVLIEFLNGNPILTQNQQVAAFEKEWSQWLGVRHSVFVNSGSSANLITLSALKARGMSGEVIVSPFGWVSDIVAVLMSGFTPVFADINLRNLSMDPEAIRKKISPDTAALLFVHAQGFNGLTNDLLKTVQDQKIALIEDVCESHGAVFRGQKLGSFGFASNFSYYFAHHMSTIEGGMVCTNDDEFYQTVRMLRSHGMVRESTSEELRQSFKKNNPELNPDFIFAYPGFNMRNNELAAVLGRNQLKRLDANNQKRKDNFKLFLENLDASKYYTDFDLEGSCNYALNLLIRHPDNELCDRVMKTLTENRIEFRRGSAGGGNQLRQPYLRGVVPEDEHLKYPNLEHVHFYGFYIGNFPDLSSEYILELCRLLNDL